MQMEGERSIGASRAEVWRALNDPDILKTCIPGCEELEKTSDTTFEASVVQKVGPVKARFKGSVELTDIVEATSYTISGEGKGGAAGFAKGGAKVRLADDGDGTLLTYDAEAKVGGKLAQLGGRLIDGFARKLADEFFTRFQEAIEGPAPQETPEETPGETLRESAATSAQANSDAETGSDTPQEKKKGWFKRLFG